MGRTSSDVMPTAIFITAHLHADSDYDTVSGRKVTTTSCQRRRRHARCVPDDEEAAFFSEKARTARVLTCFTTSSGSMWLSGRLTISVVVRNGVAMTRSRGRETPPRWAAAKAVARRGGAASTRARIRLGEGGPRRARHWARRHRRTARTPRGCGRGAWRYRGSGPRWRSGRQHPSGSRARPRPRRSRR